MKNPKNMSLRDWFAGMALQGLYSIPSVADGTEFTRYEIAVMAYKQADEMLEESYTEEDDD